MSRLVPVTKDEFYHLIGKLNVHPRVVNDKWPYTSHWIHQETREKLGESVCVDGYEKDGTKKPDLYRISERLLLSPPTTKAP